MTDLVPAYTADIQQHYVAEHTDGSFSYLTLTTKEGEVAECGHATTGNGKPHTATLRHFDVEDGPVPTYFCLPHFLAYLDDIARQAVVDARDGKQRVYTVLLSEDHQAGRIDTIVEEWVVLWVEGA